MMNVGKAFRVSLVLAMAAAFGLFIGWLASRRGDVTPVIPPAVTNQSMAVVAPVTQPAPVPAPPSANPLHSFPRKEGHLAYEHPVGWEEQLDNILLGDGDENAKADQILALIPQAPADAKQELAQHLVNMVQDDHYDGAAQMLTNASTPSDVSSVLMNDLLNRNNTLKLPMLLSIARNGDHPLKDQALDLLGLLTQEDDGTNWDQWSSTIDTWLQNNQ